MRYVAVEAICARAVSGALTWPLSGLSVSHTIHRRLRGIHLGGLHHGSPPRTDQKCRASESCALCAASRWPQRSEGASNMRTDCACNDGKRATEAARKSCEAAGHRADAGASRSDRFPSRNRDGRDVCISFLVKTVRTAHEPCSTTSVESVPHLLPGAELQSGRDRDSLRPH
jgi:hypothetical protein